jgi:hypothetical protein
MSGPIAKRVSSTGPGRALGLCGRCLACRPDGDSTGTDDCRRLGADRGAVRCPRLGANVKEEARIRAAHARKGRGRQERSIGDDGRMKDEILFPVHDMIARDGADHLHQ